MTDNQDLIYKSNNNFKKLIFAIFILAIIINFIFMLTINPISAIMMMIISFMPIAIILYYFLFIYIKPDVLYRDRLQGNIDQLNLKTQERDKIKELLFKNVNEIYFPETAFERHIYFRYNKDYEISFISGDENLENKLRALLKNQYKDKIITADEGFKTNVEKSFRLFFSIVVIYGICIFIGNLLFHQYLKNLLLILLEIVIWTIILVILMIYHIKVVEKKGSGIWNV